MSAIMKRELGKQKKLLHPNSRKINAIAKKSKKAMNRIQAKQTGYMKQNLIREKMLWMREYMEEDICPYTPELTAELLEKYISRNDEEMESIIEKKHGKKNRSHTSREDILRMSKERELDEYNGAGIEIPDILNSAQCGLLRKWDGDVRYLQNFSFRRFGKKHLDEVSRETSKAENELPNVELIPPTDKLEQEMDTPEQETTNDNVKNMETE